MSGTIDDPEELANRVSDLTAALAERDAVIAGLRDLVAGLRGTVAAQSGRIAELERRLGPTVPTAASRRRATGCRSRRRRSCGSGGVPQAGEFPEAWRPEGPRGRLLSHFRVGAGRGDMMMDTTGVAVHDHWRPYFTIPGTLPSL